MFCSHLRPDQHGCQELTHPIVRIPKDCQSIYSDIRCDDIWHRGTFARAEIPQFRKFQHIGLAAASEPVVEAWALNSLRDLAVEQTGQDVGMSNRLINRLIKKSITQPRSLAAQWISKQESL